MTPSPSAGITLGLSAAQREIWFAEQKLRRPHRVYNAGEYLNITGPVDRCCQLGPILAGKLKAIIGR